MSDDITPRQAAGGIFKWGVAFFVAIFGVFAVMYFLQLGFWAVTKPIELGRGVVNRVIDPDHALETYRWFHGTNQQIHAKKAQITLLKSALESAVHDRKEARRVELLGTQSVCQTLVSEYNARATRADTVIFMHPERFLPGDWPGERTPLPQQIDLSVCS